MRTRADNNLEKAPSQSIEAILGDDNQPLSPNASGSKSKESSPTVQEKRDSNPNDNSGRNATKKESKTNNKKQLNKKSRVIEICNNEEKISNSSTPIENEKLQRETQEIQNKDKIEIDFEMTEE